MPNNAPFNAPNKRAAARLNKNEKDRETKAKGIETEETKQLRKELEEGKVWYPDTLIKGDIGSGWDGGF